MFKVSLTDSKGFLFCILTVRDRTRLKETLAKYAKISGLSIEVKDYDR